MKLYKSLVKYFEILRMSRRNKTFKIKKIYERRQKRLLELSINIKNTVEDSVKENFPFGNENVNLTKPLLLNKHQLELWNIINVK